MSLGTEPQNRWPSVQIYKVFGITRYYIQALNTLFANDLRFDTNVSVRTKLSHNSSSTT